MTTAVKERPMLMSEPMVKATRELIKTHTRRVIKPQVDTSLWKLEAINIPKKWRKMPCLGPGHHIEENMWGLYNKDDDASSVPYTGRKCPYGKLGDRLWIKETHYLYGKWVKNGKTKTGRQRWKFKCLLTQVRYYDDVPEKVQSSLSGKSGWYKRPSIFMPRWASRIDLEITDIRVERVHDVSTLSARAEGCLPCIGKSVCGVAMCHGCPSDNPRAWFAQLWDSINAERGFGWDVNPWVWVIEFKNITEKKGG